MTLYDEKKNSSTGCTCYLHRCISYFDSLAESGVNMQHFKMVKNAARRAMDVLLK